jgi:hypothetical protein
VIYGKRNHHDDGHNHTDCINRIYRPDRPGGEFCRRVRYSEQSRISTGTGADVPMVKNKFYTLTMLSNTTATKD